MIWGSFFAGAVAMLFSMIVLLFLFPLREKTENDKWRAAIDEFNKEIINHWHDANKLAETRNVFLSDIWETLNRLSRKGHR